MRATRILCFSLSARTRAQSWPLIQISNGTFNWQRGAKRPSGETDAALFPRLSISIPAHASPSENWAILSPSSFARTTFLQVLRGQLVCEPANARSYPYLSFGKINARDPERAIQYVGFDTERRAYGGAYLSARYESRVEESDFTLEQYLTGITGMNVGEEFRKERTPDQNAMWQVVKDLELERFFTKPVSMLSNGQSRRARIGKALLTKPEMLLLDAPFIGLDPFVTQHISDLLHRMADASAPRVFVALRPQDIIPPWITHVVYVSNKNEVLTLGSKTTVLEKLRELHIAAESAEGKEDSSTEASISAEMRYVGRFLARRGDYEDNSMSEQQKVSLDGFPIFDAEPRRIGEPLVEMEGVTIQYQGNAVLGDWTQKFDGISRSGLWWTVRRGERWGIFGANGSGKTTLLSLITSDHPQTYSAPARLFQRSRLPSAGQRGISIFELQSRIGHASPEVHALFPRKLTVRRALESAFADTPLAVPKLFDDASTRVEACLRWFAPELLGRSKTTLTPVERSDDLSWASNTLFGELSFSAQRVLLFLRALIRRPDIVILDEAFSGMDDLARDKCLLFLSQGDKMQLDFTGADGDSRTAGPVPVKSHIATEGISVISGITDDQALLCISHQKEDVPGCMREWICLPEAGTGSPRIGRLDGPVELDARRWREIWGH